MRFLFDLTTSSQWTGTAVGILRVERELARYAREHLGQEIEFCIYQRSSNTFFKLLPQHAAAIIDAKIAVDLDRRAEVLTTLKFQVLRRQLRRIVLRFPRVYQAIQRLRGRRFSLQYIREVQAEAESEANTQRKTRELLTSVTEPGPISLGPDVTIISGGLDWEFKDLRNIGKLKQEHGFKYCAILYDLIPIKFPHYVVPGYVTLLHEYFGELVWVADRFMCISSSTRSDLLDYFDSLGLPPPQAHVFSLGCDIGGNQTTATLPEILKGKRFALFVSTIEPRKNHGTLYQAWERAVRAGRLDPDGHRLVFLGRIGWAVDDLVREIRANPATRDSIVILDQVDDATLNLLYRASAFVVFPSFYEGYGLPVAEALAYGKLCICSNAGSLSEIGGDYVLRVDPQDTIGLSEAIVRYMNSDADTKDWEDKVRARHRTVTWNDAARHFFRNLDDRRGLS